MGMKRSEKEAEVRKLLETPGAVVQLPAGMSLQDAADWPGTIVRELVNASEPPQGWEIGPTPSRIKLNGNYTNILPLSGKWANNEEREDTLRLAVNTYNDMKEAEEAEADPNDPLTAGLQKLAAEEIAVLVRDAAKVTREETTRQMESWYTREGFVAAEVELSLGVEEPEDIDPDALVAIRRRAEWNAQAAERAGVVWCAGGSDRVAPSGHNKAWIHYCDSGLVANHTMPRETFNAGFDYGYQAGWRARMDTLNPVCSPEAADEVVDETLATEYDNKGALDRRCMAAIAEVRQELEELEKELEQEVEEIVNRLDQHKASIAAIAEEQTRVELESRERDSGLDHDRRVLSGSVQKLQNRMARQDAAIDRMYEETVQRITALENDNAANKDSLRELRDLGQRALDRLDQHTSSSAVTITLLRESIDGAHDRLQRHDVRITKAEEQIRTFIQPSSDSKKGS